MKPCRAPAGCNLRPIFMVRHLKVLNRVRTCYRVVCAYRRIGGSTVSAQSDALPPGPLYN